MEIQNLFIGWREKGKTRDIVGERWGPEWPQEGLTWFLRSW